MISISFAAYGISQVEKALIIQKERKKKKRRKKTMKCNGALNNGLTNLALMSPEFIMAKGYPSEALLCIFRAQ